MTNQDILNMFGNNTNTYTFSGTVQELQELQESTNNSYGFNIFQGTIYFWAEKPVTDSRAIIITGE
jgi:hypothetical protein